MEKSYLDQVYALNDPEAKQRLYDEWGASYDTDLQGAGYATPARIAEALSEMLPDKSAPILDFGCGTGLSGEALAHRGFTVIDGVDPSEGMLAEARAKNVYRELMAVPAGEPIGVKPGHYAAIVACGVISEGAAPPETFDIVTPLLAPGQLLAVSYNDHTLESAEYTEKMAALIDGGFERLAALDGPHIPARGSTSRIYVLRRKD
ncbi:class I SAM-dependent DNA methyltransferase [Histidinibacterium aquaticum]|uniref:Methyltransferase domain-containing protein n=1 Tax=Histidinibacterium aquaticum TaxID=2613962 RepID=A0A5J5GL68_9RHOB|nr:methyltransferase domain-containing protein [Histidinibacterium aquaticum]KAA9009049.1 methyltransferase domain-containing protein [Histidinibacterium aquaticum]